MLPIRFAVCRRFSDALLPGLSLLLLLGGAGVFWLQAGPLPVQGVDEFRPLIDSRRRPRPEPGQAGQTLAEYRRRLRQAAKDLPSLGEVSRVLLLSEWSSVELDLVGMVNLDRVGRAVRLESDEAFTREVQKLMKENPEDPDSVNQAVVAEIKREVRLQLLDRLENRVRYYLRQGRIADRIAAANLISDTLSTSRRQDISQYYDPETKVIVPGVMAPRAQEITRGYKFRERLRSLSSDLERLIGYPDTEVRVAAIRALSDQEIDPAVLVTRLKPLLASEQSDAPTRRAAAEALGHVLEVYTTQMDKTRPEPYLKAMEQVLPAAASGLSDTDPLVRRASLESCQRAALVLQDLAGDPLAATERLVVFRPAFSAVDSVLPKINASARDRIPELRVAASHVLETFALTVQRMRYRAEPLPAPSIDKDKPVPQPNKEPPSTPKKQTSLISPNPMLIRTTALDVQLPDQLPPPLPIPVAEGRIEGTIKAMMENLKHPDYRVRLAAVDTLETYGRFAAMAIPSLVESLRDYNKFVRWSSARTLGRLAPRQPDEVVPGLMRMLDDREDPSVRIAAAQALELYGEHARKAVPLLARVINRGDREYILAILKTIQGIGTDAAPALPNVAWILVDRTQPPSVRIEAANTLGRFGTLAKNQLPILREVMNTDSDEDVRNAASLAVLAVDRFEK